MFVVKKAKGDTLSTATFFTGLSGNKMIDTINTERFTVLYSRTFKLTARNQGTLQNEQGVGSGLYGVASSSAYQGAVLSRATRIIKVYVPGSTFIKSRKVTYKISSPSDTSTRYSYALPNFVPAWATPCSFRARRHPSGEGRTQTTSENASS
jgi:hypothetical protein